ncbi:MAG: alpha-amylase family glycosyl hydrolase [Roseiflexaceae bacterium]
MPDFTTSQDRHTITVTTPELELAFSRDDGGLRVLRRIGGPNVLGHGQAIPAIDVQVGIEGVWLADRVFVRYLGHSVDERDGAIEIVIVIGIGPLMLYDRYRVTGALIARRVSVKNVSEDEIQLRRVRMALPWVRLGEQETCRFEAPGNSARPAVPITVAAAQRRGVLPRQFFAAGLRDGRALELAPAQAPGLMALHDPPTQLSLLCWYYSEVEPAQPMLEGNDRAVTLIHELELADRLRSEVVLSGGTQYVLLLAERWPAALEAFRRTEALVGVRLRHETPAWLRDASIYEVHPAELGGFRALAGMLGSLQRLGITTLCLLPIWEFAKRREGCWDGNWIDNGNPYALRDLAALDQTLGSPDDLRTLVARAHDLGMRVLVDLPLAGCAFESPYLEQHPDWFCRDEADTVVPQPGMPEIASFDWASADLQRFVLDQATAQAREYAFDGYRVFPPRHAPPNWTRRLAHHASAGTLGVLRLIDGLRGALREHHSEAVVVSALAGPAYSIITDAALDELPHHQILHMALDRMAPDELGAWLEAHTAALPEGALRICFTESHATRLLNPLADGLRGSRISRMALVGLVLCGFVPMVVCGQEHADEAFIGRLLRTRQAYPALRHGRTFYGRVRSSSGEVFVVLRQSEGQQLIGVLNVGPHKQTVQLQLPLAIMSLPEGDYALDELIGQEPSRTSPQTWPRAGLEALSLTIEPFGAYCFLLRKVETATLDIPHESPADQEVLSLERGDF